IVSSALFVFHPPPTTRTPLFPYTTLFRSCPEREINKPGLLALRAHLLTLGNLQAIALPGLEPERASILPAGVAILLALFDAFSIDRKSTRLNSSHVSISYAVFCLKKKTQS